MNIISQVRFAINSNFIGRLLTTLNTTISLSAFGNIGRIC